MTLENLLNSLGYSESPNYFDIEKSSEKGLNDGVSRGINIHFLRLAGAAKISGVYTFQASPASQRILPPHMAVCVASAKNTEEAHSIHRKVWNLGNAPFLIVLLENRIHVYTGFDYEEQDTSIGLLASIEIVSNLFDEIDLIKMPELASFTAESIDTGRVWSDEASKIDLSRKVDRRLLNNLSYLEKELYHRFEFPDGLSLNLIHSLIGKYLYIRYLRDRNILDDVWLQDQKLSISKVLGRKATKAGLLQLSRAIENYFKGDIFPFPAESENFISDELVRLVASVFNGDDILTGQQHLDFNAYDFSFIPVETLSAIYQQFLNAKGKGKTSGAVYTPEPLADYLVREVESVLPLERGMKVLDPSCGSGIFLVQAYRLLIEKQLLKNRRNKISRSELKKILQESIFGVEKDVDACYVTELSLILTMLDYIEPRTLNRHKDFEFPTLHNHQIFHCDFFDPATHFVRESHHFDWIIGNPPWSTVDKSDPEQFHLLQWIQDNENEMPVANLRPGEAFSWKVVEYCKPSGIIGLILHATSLTNHNSLGYRKSFFEKNEVFRVTNFSNLGYILFDRRAQAPAYTIVFRPSAEQSENTQILHFAPMVADQTFVLPFIRARGRNKHAWTLTINEDEVQYVNSWETALSEAATWKLAMWGTNRDVRLLQRLRRHFPQTLEKLVSAKDWLMCRGIELRRFNGTDQNGNQKTEAADYLKGWKRLNPDSLIDTGHRFQVSNQHLEEIPEDELHIRIRGGKQGLGLSYAPHLVLGISYSAFSDEDFVITNKPIGIAARPEDANYLRALSIYLNSSICRYMLFFLSASWGIDRNTLTLNDLKDLPVPNFTSEQVNELSRLHRKVAAHEEQESKSYDEIRKIIDAKIAELFQLPDYLNQLVDGFMGVKLGLLKGKVAESSLRSPNEDEYLAYGRHLKTELDQFNQANSLRHNISITYSHDLVFCTVRLVPLDRAAEIRVAPLNTQLKSTFAALQARLTSKRSQWIYVQKGLRIYEMSQVHICKKARLIDWTTRQAIIDAGDIFSEVIIDRPYLNTNEVDKFEIAN